METVLKKEVEMTPQQKKMGTLMLVLSIIVYFVLNFERIAIPGQIIDSLQSELKLTALQVTSLGPYFTYIYAITQLVAGLFADKYGGERTLYVGGLLMLVGAFLFPISEAYWKLCVCRFITGLGAGTIYISLLKQVDRVFPQKYAVVVGLVILFGYSGSVVGTTPFVIASSHWGWRACLLAPAILGTLALIIISLIFKNVSKQAIRPGMISLRPYWDVFTNVNPLKMIASLTINYGMYFAIVQVLGKKFLENMGGVSPTLASTVCSAMTLVPALACQVVSTATVAMGNRRKLLFAIDNILPFLGFSTTLFALLNENLAGRSTYFIVGFVLICLVGGFTPITSSMSREYNARENMGAGAGAVNCCNYFFSAVFGNVIGIILNHFGGVETEVNGKIIMNYPKEAYVTIFMTFTIISVFCFIASCFVKETYGKNIYNGKVIRFLGLKLHS